jgi:very-short-patch-repair endonuclease
MIFATLCDAHGLPAPQTNVRVEGFTVDAFWREARLIAEADSYEFHHMPTAFETDRLRDQRLIAAGYRVVRFPRTQVGHRPAEVLAVLWRMLDDSGVETRPPRGLNSTQT